MARSLPKYPASLVCLLLVLLGMPNRAEGQVPRTGPPQGTAIQRSLSHQAMASAVPVLSGWSAPRRDVLKVKPGRLPGRQALTEASFFPPRGMGTPRPGGSTGTRCSSCSSFLLPTFWDPVARRPYSYGKTISDRPKLYIDINAPEEIEEGVNFRATLYKADQEEPIADIIWRYSYGAGLYEVDFFEDKSPGATLALETGKTYTVTVEVACLDDTTSSWSYRVYQGVI
ncbi:MAG: hypothetical protein AAF685_14345 [Cyanobacteria bacterium P01_C01_bin.89]